eukprot:1140933-Pelagomonas_calceolata.AAC.11
MAKKQAPAKETKQKQQAVKAETTKAALSEQLMPPLRCAVSGSFSAAWCMLVLTRPVASVHLPSLASIQGCHGLRRRPESMEALQASFESSML